MNQELRRQSNIFVAAGLGIGALVLYLVTLSRGAFPGEPAFLACEVTGLFPRLSPSHPVWNLVAKAASAVPLGSLVGRLNVLSALCGAASIGLFYTVITDAIGLCIQAGEGRRHHARVAAHAGGVGAAVFLATSIPFWIVSNRAHTAALDILMLLGAIALLVGYARTGAKWRLWACTFLYAVGMVEFATFIIFFPLFGVLLLYQMWRHGQLQPKPVIVTLVIGLLGLSVCLLAAWAFRDTPGYELREYRGLAHMGRAVSTDHAESAGNRLASGSHLDRRTVVGRHCGCTAIAQRRVRLGILPVARGDDALGCRRHV